MSLDFIKQKRNIIVPVILLTISLGLLTFNSAAGPDRSISPFGRMVVEILSYPQSLLSGLTGGFGSIWERYFHLRGVEQENEVLRRDIESLSFEMQKMREELALTKMNLPGPIWQNSRLLPANIIGYSPRSEFMTYTLDVGSSDGVRYGLPVVTGTGVVGKIIGMGREQKVPPHSSQMLMLLDPRCRVDALVYRMDTEKMPDPSCPWNPSNWRQNRVRGVVQGNRYGLILKFVERGADVKEGDMVVSSGLGGVFPKGLYIGSISDIGPTPSGLGMEVKVLPGVDFERLEGVLVMFREMEPAP